jgi:hypothetical protein
MNIKSEEKPGGTNYNKWDLIETSVKKDEEAEKEREKIEKEIIPQMMGCSQDHSKVSNEIKL